MEEQLEALEEECLQWDVHTKIGEEGKNYMQHCIFVWCELCRKNSVVSWETYMQGGDETYKRCPVAYYASILQSKELYITRTWHWEGVEEAMKEMRAAYSHAHPSNEEMNEKEENKEENKEEMEEEENSDDELERALEACLETLDDTSE